jgi:hypothetical protein
VSRRPQHAVDGVAVEPARLDLATKLDRRLIRRQRGPGWAIAHPMTML